MDTFTFDANPFDASDALILSVGYAVGRYAFDTLIKPRFKKYYSSIIYKKTNAKKIRSKKKSKKFN